VGAMISHLKWDNIFSTMTSTIDR